MNKKELVAKYRGLVSLACRIHNLRNTLRIKGRGRGNRIVAPCALMKRVKIHFYGSNNTVIIDDFSVLKDVQMYVSGDHNTVHVGPWCHLNRAEFCTENDHNTITVGAHTRILGQTRLAAIEGTTITIGEDCLFSSEVHVRTGDSHSVLDLQGKRINPSEDVMIGNHVWMGTQTTCLKGSVIPDGNIVGACALVTKRFTQPNCALAGVPARVVKQEVDWCLNRIPVQK